MLLSMLHGLKLIKNPIPSQNDFSTLIANAFIAPVGKSYGSYTIDSNTNKTLVLTENLPDFSGGYLKKVQIDFLIDRCSTPNGDFVIATARPLFPSNLGTPIIDEQYLTAIKERKFITYQDGSGWTNWKELNSGIITRAFFTFDNNAVQEEVAIDPTTVTEYFLELKTNSNIKIKLYESNFFNKTIYIDINPETANYVIEWDNKLTWVGGTPPQGVDATSRISITIQKNHDNEYLASFKVYQVI